ncbi:TonB-dependent receptor [uncultured Dysgonomonas sp.]|uniref:TonB-dependent receptor plug n=1 Tax=uncultured Dysgonomonas sp. TaxID=206096 RepID=A0A212JDC0_9BACT|nr:TonB-dependent receptor [uncultured Dysgonomonas sp.]SBV97265.1 TonB-dependent receptor plug [uncultured Dysgonomonas sp.]
MKKIFIKLLNSDTWHRKALNKALLFSLCLIMQMVTGTPVYGETKDSEQATKKEISGSVYDTDELPLPGATVIEKNNSMNSTLTDADGLFKLTVSEGSIVIISYLGYITQEFVVDRANSYPIILHENTKDLDEVVVVGYGTVKKKDLTGAVGAISGNIVSDRKVMQLSTALQGAIPGVMVTRNNGAPGGGSTIRIRGITTIGDSNPLYIVDGVPVDNIDYINPNDVENISVLKDAASASIYGSRAASGVILITTKRGTSDKFELNYSFEYGLEKLARTPKFVSATRFMQMENELRWNDAGNGKNEYPTYAQELIENYYALHAEDADLYPITDWYDLVLDKTAPRVSHLVSLMGGTNKLRTKASFGYDKVEGMYANKNIERYTLRVNNDIKINEYLSVGLDINFRNQKNLSPVADPFPQINLATAVQAGVWSDGRYGNGRGKSNIYAASKEGGTTTNTHNHFLGKASLDFTPFEGFKLSAVFSPTYNNSKSKMFKKKVKLYDAKDPNLFIGYNASFDNSRLEENRNDSYRLLSQLIATYSKSFSDHNFDFMAGYEGYKTFNENLYAGRNQYVLEYPYLDIGPLTELSNSGNAYETAYQSFFGRIMYNFKNRYLLQANVRRDGSSRFHKDHRWGVFPSVSAGWVISEESFFPENNILSFLKLRGSWGTLGNERIGSNYPYQAAISFSNVLFINGDNVVPQQTASQNKYAVSDISWETTKSWNIGIDTYLFNNRLRLSADYFDKSTEDMLLALEIPRYMGFSTNPDVNAGKMSTKGFEIEVGWSDQIGKDWFYSLSANLSDFRSKMGELGGTEFLGSKIKKQGSEFDEWYGYLSDGIFQTQEEVDNSPVLNKQVKPGDIKYKDISGPNGVPDGVISPEYDRTLLGGSLPRYLYGANFSLGYRNIDFSLTIQGVGKKNSIMSTYMVQPLIENRGNITDVIESGYWSHYNPAEENVHAKYPRLTYSGATNNYATSDFWMFNGRYLRLKNITVGYTLQLPWLQNTLKVQNIRLYTAINDLFSIDNYPKGWDPETAGGSQPITTSFIFGASVNF